MPAAVVCATLRGFFGYTGNTEWLRLQPFTFWLALSGKQKTPCDDAFRYLLMQLCPTRFEAVLNRWIADRLRITLGDTLQGLVFDGKDQFVHLDDDAALKPAAENPSIFRDAVINYLRTQKTDNITASLRKSAVPFSPINQPPPPHLLSGPVIRTPLA